MRKLMKFRFIAVLVVLAMILIPTLASADQGNQTVAEMAGGQAQGIGIGGVIALVVVGGTAAGCGIAAFGTNTGASGGTPVTH